MLYPGHNCIDNAIHTFAGVQLRNECHQIMSKQRYLEPTGKAKITNAYNLPCRYIVHTVGPIVHNVLTDEKRFLLAECYRNCLKAEVYGLKSIAFVVSLQEYLTFLKKAAQIAVNTVSTFLKGSQIEKVIFNVFKEDDEMIISNY
ncbi:MAG: macro domain-containing protein [Thomasclavelia ramosa]